jgi:lysophospholipase L1-like esterase
MTTPIMTLAALVVSGFSLDAAAAPSTPDAQRPIRVILVGDSTMASKSGYGDALCDRFTPAVSCTNLAKGGRSSGSFRAEGLWDEVERLLRDKQSFAASYVLVQFGHNDQPGRPGRSTDFVTGFPVNMARYASEVRQLGGIPVLLTPLTRREFRGPYLHDDLAPWAAATRRMAARENTALLDLNAESTTAVQAMGQAEADTLAMEPPPASALASTSAPPADANRMEPAGTAKSKFDHTHLGAKGADYFARMVAHELAAALPEVAPYLRKPETQR